MTVPFSSLINHSPILLDGGLGTTLEDYVGLDISHSPLWSAQPIASASEEITKAHLLFLRAGARIISTSTYQCSIETFQAAGYGVEKAKSLMLDSVHIAKKAKVTFEEESTDSGSLLQERILIALSLGPFGAVLKPTQEFRGYYPPPHGPKGYSKSHINQNAFEQNETGKEAVAIDVLTKFHYDRLLVFASSIETWNAIDCIAFETVPLKREVAAIRRAVQLLQLWLTGEGLEQAAKPWWISCVFPDGESPGDAYPGGPKLKVDEMLNAAFSNETDPLPIPSGFGINCTKPGYLMALVTAAGRYFKTLGMPEASKPWLIMYPNGNDVYDEETRSWTGRAEESVEWSKEISKVVFDAMGARLLGQQDFGGIIVGGCCKTGPDHISSLRIQLRLATA